jgi:hypothetical protein
VRFLLQRWSRVLADPVVMIRLATAVKEPAFVTTDYTKEHTTAVIHAAYAAAHVFMVRVQAAGCIESHLVCDACLGLNDRPTQAVNPRLGVMMTHV